MNLRPISTKFLKNLFLVFFIFLAFLGTFLYAPWAQEYPSREIKLVVPLSPGGGMDVADRVFADKVEKILGVPVVVVNNGGGGGVAGSLTVAQAKPDGYTVLAGPSGHIVLKPFMTPDLPYRVTDFTSICRIFDLPTLMMVNNDAPWKGLKDLADYAKKNPGKLTASVGTGGGFLQVLTDLFKTEAGIDFVDIPSPTGGVFGSAALLGGHADFCTDPVANNIDFVRAGRVRVLASTHKIPGFPMIKTFEEQGYPGVLLKNWCAILGPKGLPQPIVTKLTKAFEKACNDRSLQEQTAKLYVFPAYQNPEETSKMIEKEREIALKILKKSGMVK